MFIKGLISKLISKGYKPVFIPSVYYGTGRENDIAFYRELVNERIITSTQILGKVTSMLPSEVSYLLKSFYAMVSTRTHPYILARVASIKAMHLAYEHKGIGIPLHTFHHKPIPLLKCLKSIDDCVHEVISGLEQSQNSGSLREISTAREHNKKIVKTILEHLTSNDGF